MNQNEHMVEDIKKFLKTKGYKLTSQRIEILKVLCESREKHLTAEEICKLANVSYSRVGISTVYKTMMQFEKVGLLYRISIYGYCSRYQLMLPGEENKHRHFVCTRCGKILDINPKEFADAEHRLESKYGICIEGQNLLYYGICKECSSLGSIK